VDVYHINLFRQINLGKLARRTEASVVNQHFQGFNLGNTVFNSPNISPARQVGNQNLSGDRVTLLQLSDQSCQSLPASGDKDEIISL